LSVEPLESRRLLSGAVEHVIHISVDGLRPDAVTQLGATELPNFYRLRTAGAFTDNARTDHDYTITLPNHATQVTGRPVVGTAGHNWASNSDPAAGQTLHSTKGSYVASFWDVAHDQGLRTGLYASKTKFSLFDTSYDGDSAALQGGAPDLDPIGGDNGRDKIDLYRYESNTGTLTDAFVSAMSANPFHLAMLHYHDPDTVGHAKGWMSGEYFNSLRFVDQQLGKLFALLDAAGSALFGSTAVILTADHGGTGTGHGDANDPQSYTLPFYVWGPGVEAGADLYQLNATARTDPGAGRLDNGVRPQPIRDGDAANLALQLLDLPSVEGSLFNARQDLIVGPADPVEAPSAVVSAPIDDGPLDLDPAAGAVRVTATQPSFIVGLSDAEGVDDATVTPQALRMTLDGFAFDGYSFAYDGATDTVTLTPGAGGNFSYGQYEIYLNDTRTRIADLGGGALSTTILRIHVDGTAVQPTTASFQQGVNGYAGTRDTMLQENSPGTSFALAPSLNVDNDEPPNSTRDVQGLVRFENLFGTAAGQVPPGAEIRSATLELRIFDPGASVRLHRMLTGWSDTDTWDSMTAGISADGIEAAATADGSTPASVSGIISIDVTASVAAWLSNPSGNFGWALLPSGSDGVDFDSAESTTVSYRPRLVVEYVAGSPPVANDDAYSVDEDATLTVAAPGVLGNDWDAEGDLVSAALDSAPGNGSVNLNADGSLTYTPNADFSGTDAFTYRTSDGGSFSNVATVTITVLATPDAPVAADDAYALDEDSPLGVAAPGVLANDSDPDDAADPDHAQPLTAALVAGPTHGAVILNADGSFTYTPLPDYHGTDSFSYATSDGSQVSAPATVTLTVRPVNDDLPVSGDDAAATDEDAPVTIDVLANDTDGDNDPLTPLIQTSPANGTVAVNADGSMTYTPMLNFHGTDSFTYAASDGTGTGNTAVVSVTVNPVNDAPEAVDDSAATDEEVAVTIAVLATDTDAEADALTTIIVDSPANGEAVVNADGSVTYTPNLNYFGTDSFTYRAFDGSLGSELARVTITVRDTDDGPATANDDVASTDEDRAVIIGVLANDTQVDGDVLTPEIVGAAANGTAAVNADGTITYTPAANFAGAGGFTYRLFDGTSYGNVATVAIDVLPVNDAPAAGDDAFEVGEDATLSIAAPGVLANDGDVEGDALGAVLVSGPAHGLLTLNGDGSFTYAPDADFAGTDSFTYAAGDGSAQSAAATVTLTVTPANDAPTVVAPLADTSVPEGTTQSVIDLSGTFADIDGDDLVLSVENDNPALLTASIAGSMLTLTYAAGVTGSAGITVRATDPAGAAAEDAFVAAVTLAPPAYAGGESTVHGTVSAGGLNATVSDDDAYEAIREASYANGKRNRLEHRWTFELGSATGGTFHVQAHASTGANEGFGFEYSADGTNWISMVSVTGTVDADQSQTFQLPSPVTGRTYVRVVDANPSGEDSSADTIYVDHMFIRTASGGGIVLPTITIAASDPNAAESGDPGVFTVTRTGDTSQELIVSYGTSGTATAGADHAALSGTVTILAGSSTASFSVNPIDDALVEGSEDVIVTLSGGTAYTVGSAASATVVIADDDVATPDTEPPTAPGALNVIETTSTSVSLAWTASGDNVGVTSYEIRRDGVIVATTTGTNYTDSGLSASTQYTYTVRAYDAAGNVSAESNAVAATTQAAPVGPAAPSNLTAEQTQRTKVRLKWQDNSTDEGGFYVYTSSDGVTWTRYATVAAKNGSGSTIQFTTGTLASGTHYYRVTAFNASGESAPSEAASVLLQ
jgi:VCBS repeat-containing protein